MTGASGALGRAVVHEFRQYDTVVELEPFDHEGLDITDAMHVTQALLILRPHVVINCAAYTDVDKAQTEPSEAMRVNNDAVRHLADETHRLGMVLIHFSTDYVFAGTAFWPYTETSPTNPCNEYGRSKLSGEQWALARGAYVLRVSSLFNERGTVGALLSQIAATGTARVSSRRTVTLAYAEDVATAARKIAESRPEPGVYHCVNSGATNWPSVAQYLARLIGSSVEFQTFSPTQVAPRPDYSVLANDKLRRAKIVMPTWGSALERFVLANY